MTTSLLALGLVLYPSTQLRISGLPVGPGEILLLTWLGLAVARHTLNMTLAPNVALTRIGSFWLVIVLAQCVGMIAGLALELFQDYGGIIHDIAAYALLIALGCMFSLELVDPVRRRRVVWLVVIFGAALILLQIATGWGVISVPGVDPWFYDRLRGWSLDPNQLGLFTVIITILAVHLAETSRRTAEAVAALAFGAPAFAAGLLSRSDTFIVALMTASAVIVVLKSITWIQNVEMRPMLRGATVILGLLSLPLALAAAVPFWSATAERVGQWSAEVYTDSNQVETRLNLWGEAVEKGMESGMVGYGPGPHLTSKSYKRPPPDKFEAHNTSLDLFTQGGFIALTAFVWLCVSTLADTWRARLPALAALIVGVAVFSMFHFVVRHPIFWFGIVLCLLEAETGRAGVVRESAR